MPIDAQKPSVVFLLHNLIEILPEGVIRRGERVERHVGEVDELHLWRIVSLGERINLREPLHQIHARFRVAVDQELRQGDPDAERRWAQDELTFRAAVANTSHPRPCLAR